MAELEDIAPIMDDTVAVKILSLMRHTQCVEEIGSLLGIGLRAAETKVALIKKLGLIGEDGQMSIHAKNLVLAHASASLKSSSGRKR